MSSRSRKGVSAGDVVGGIIAVLIVLGALFLFAGCMVQVNRPSSVHIDYFTKDYLKHEFQLDTAKTYKLQLGAAIGGGTVGSFSTHTSFFLFGGSSTTSGQFTPSSTVRLGFRSASASYILEIPYSKVKFEPIAGAKSHVKFVVDSDEIDYRSRQDVGHHFFKFQRGHLEKQAPINKTRAWPRVAAEGLPTFLSNHLIRVVLTLTPQQYQAYLGTLQPPGK